ncbi:MAG: class I SAM-dependent methyltransferase [Patescibacteria group bacterium]|jgi:SAM-dependent methyltransferase
MQVIMWFYVIFLLILLGFLVKILVNLILLVIFQKQTLPFVPTTRRVAKFVAKLADVNNKVRVVDLGSGTGTLLAALYKQNPTKQYIGVERSWLLVWLSWLRFLVSNKKNTPKIVQADFFNYPLQEADVIIGYWISSLAERLTEKFVQECKPGCLIISCVFKLTPHERIIAKPVQYCGKTKIYCYEIL